VDISALVWFIEREVGVISMVLRWTLLLCIF